MYCISTSPLKTAFKWKDFSIWDDFSKKIFLFLFHPLRWKRIFYIKIYAERLSMLWILLTTFRLVNVTEVTEMQQTCRKVNNRCTVWWAFTKWTSPRISLRLRKEHRTPEALCPPPVTRHFQTYPWVILPHFD